MKAFLAFFALFLTLAGPVAARDASAATGSHPFGVGAILGEPTGLVAKFLHTPSAAIDLGVAFSFNSFFLFYADYLAQFPGVLKGTEFTRQLIPYVGVGGVVFVSSVGKRSDGRFYTSDGSTFGLGIRIPVGIEWRPSNPPIGVFVELAPGVGIIPGTFGFLQGGIGARFYF